MMHAALVIVIYSASTNEITIIFFFFDDHQTSLEPIQNKYLNILFNHESSLSNHYQSREQACFLFSLA